MIQLTPRGYYWFRAAFKFGRRVHYALCRKMRKPPVNRVPAILNGLTNRPSWKTDSIFADIVMLRPTIRLQFRSIQSSIEENGRSSQFLLVSECISVFRVTRCLKVGTYLSNKGIINLLYLLCRIHILVFLLQRSFCSSFFAKRTEWMSFCFNEL